MTVDVYCLPDTNFFHHYQFFTDVDWSQLLGAGLVHVVVTSPVLQELENHKNDRVSRRRRDRSRAVLRRIDDLMSAPTPGEKVEFRKRAYLQLVLDSPDMDKYKGRLEPSVMDDRIIAHALGIQEQTGQHVILLTDDVGMKIKARGMGLSVTSPPEELRLSDETTDEERIARLGHETAARPNLGFWLNGTLRPSASYVLHRAAMNAAEIEAAATTRLEELVRKSRSRGMLKGVYFPSEEEEARRYIGRYSSYLQLRNHYLDHMGHLVILPLAIFNDSHIPAEDVTVDIAVSGPWELVVADAKITPPDEPPLPTFAARGFTRISPTPRSGVEWPKFDSERWEFMHTRFARFRFSRLVHGVKEPLDPLLACVTSEAESELQLDYDLYASNAPEPTSGKLIATATWSEWEGV
jgi:PIN domain